MEWPRSVKWISGLAENFDSSIKEGKPGKPLRLFFPAVLLRNLFFLTVVLLHGFRRLAPPY